MSTAASVDVTAAINAQPNPPAASRLTTSLTFARRGWLKIRHVPEQLADAIMIPVLFTVMFTYLFGGAISGSTSEYLHFLLPGTLVMSVLLITGYAGTNLNADRMGGAFDRFRSMPIWRPALIVGGLISDVGRNVLAAVIVLVLGLAMGFRPDGGLVGVMLAIGLVLVFAFGLSWIWALLGLTLRSQNAVMMTSFLVQFPLVFVSNVFVDPATMPGWLQAFVDVNPVTLLVTAVRGLVHGTPANTEIAFVLAATVAMVLVFGPLTMRIFRRL